MRKMSRPTTRTLKVTLVSITFAKLMNFEVCPVNNYDCSLDSSVDGNSPNRTAVPFVPQTQIFKSSYIAEDEASEFKNIKFEPQN